MRKFLTFSLLLLLSVTFFSCGADGELDEALLDEYVDRFKDEVMPTKEEFKRMAEKQIANLPADEQADARKDLQEALDNWPSDAQIDEMVDKAVNDLPDREKIDEALSEISEEGGIFGRMISGAIRGAIKEAPSADEVNKMVDESLNEVSKQVDSLRRTQ